MGKFNKKLAYNHKSNYKHILKTEQKLKNIFIQG